MRIVPSTICGERTVFLRDAGGDGAAGEGGEQREAGDHEGGGGTECAGLAGHRRFLSLGCKSDGPSFGLIAHLDYGP